MAIRIAESMRLAQPGKKPGEGRIVQSTGVRDGQTWGKRAEWCDYSGPVNGKTVGIAIFDHIAGLFSSLLVDGAILVHNGEQKTGIHTLFVAVGIGFLVMAIPAGNTGARTARRRAR